MGVPFELLFELMRDDRWVEVFGGGLSSVL